jgi:hypothetical protein
VVCSQSPVCVVSERVMRMKMGKTPVRIHSRRLGHFGEVLLSISHNIGVDVEKPGTFRPSTSPCIAVEIMKSSSKA